MALPCWITSLHHHTLVVSGSDIPPINMHGLCYHQLVTRTFTKAGCTIQWRNCNYTSTGHMFTSYIYI